VLLFQEVAIVSEEVNARLDKIDARIAKLLEDKKMIEGKMFDCGNILKTLELGNQRHRLVVDSGLQFNLFKQIITYLLYRDEQTPSHSKHNFLLITRKIY